MEEFYNLFGAFLLTIFYIFRVKVDGTQFLIIIYVSFEWSLVFRYLTSIF